MAAARFPARSEPVKSQFFFPMATGRMSFWDTRVGHEGHHLADPDQQNDKFSRARTRFLSCHVVLIRPGRAVGSLCNGDG